MTTKTLPPWSNYPDAVSAILVRLQAEFKERIVSGSFRLSMYSEGRTRAEIAELMDDYWWRSYFIVATVKLALQQKPDEPTLVEAGVADGRGAWFALGAAFTDDVTSEYWAYDSWSAMRPQELLPSEGGAGKYSYLSKLVVEENLREFMNNINFCQGFVPESFQAHPGPAEVNWLHIDINSAQPTRATLEQFWDRMPVGAVVLLDDYSWPGYVDTKTTCDEFFALNNQWVLALPTGQGLVIKN